MINLQEATERICELKGSLVALEALSGALLQQLHTAARAELKRTFAGHTEVARTAMLNASISDHTIAAFETDVRRLIALMGTLDRIAPGPPPVVEPLLLAATRVSTFVGDRALTGASGFFFERDDRLYLVTSRHVLIDEPTKHYPDRIEIELHADEKDMTRSTAFSMLLYEDGIAAWHQGMDSGGEVDVAALRIDRTKLGNAALRAFGPQHLQKVLADVPIGAPLLVVGFPLGFHDGLHHLPVARQAAVASSFGTRFQGQGLFLTDARTHRGSSGAPVVMRDPAAAGSGLPWKLLGVHSSRMDMESRDLVEDESLGLNCAWYADIVMTLTAG